MKRITFGLSMALLGAAVLPLEAQYPTTPPPAAPLRRLEFPPFQLAQLNNGLELLVVENHELPVVSISLTMRAGSKYEPEGLEGLTGFVAELMTKGTESRTAEQIAETIEGVGSSLFAAPGGDFLTISTTVLTDYVPLAFDLASDILLRATFPEEEIELARTRFLSALQAEKSSPGALAARYFARELYGDHPYGRQPSEASTKAVTRESIRDFVKARLSPQGALLVVAGDIDLSRTRELAQRYLGDWRGAAPAETFPAPPRARPTDILLVHRPGSAQSNILVGNLAMRPGDPQYYAAVIANRVLGGGSDARLFKILREARGWTYGAYCRVTRPQEIGYFQANAEVRNEVTDSALVELLSQLRRIRAEAPPDSEMTAAKGYLVGSFPRQIETPSQIASQVSTTRLLGLGDDYLQTYRERLSAVSAQDAMQATRRVIHPDSAVIVVVGDGQAIYDKLASVAPVRIIDVEGNPLTADDLIVTAVALEVDAARLVARRDSFEMIAQGSPIGFQVTELSRANGTVVYTETLSIAMFGMSQETRVEMAIEPVTMGKVDQTIEFGGQKAETHLAFSEGRVTGHAESPQPTGEFKAIDIDTTVVEGAVEENAIQALLPALLLAEGASIALNVFAGSEGTTKPMTLKVTGVEEVTVPAGTFSAFRVELTGGEQPLAFFVSRDAPRRLVKIEAIGQPFSFVLVQ